MYVCRHKLYTYYLLAPIRDTPYDTTSPSLPPRANYIRGSIALNPVVLTCSIVHTITCDVASAMRYSSSSCTYNTSCRTVCVMYKCIYKYERKYLYMSAIDYHICVIIRNKYEL